MEGPKGGTVTGEEAVEERSVSKGPRKAKSLEPFTPGAVLQLDSLETCASRHSLAFLGSHAPLGPLLFPLPQQLVSEAQTACATSTGSQF